MRVGTKRKTVPLWQRGRLFVVQPGWNSRVEFTFTDRGELLKWARNHNVILKEVTRGGNRRDAVGM